MFDFNVNCLIIDLPVAVFAFTKDNFDGTFTIVINAKHSFEKQHKSYLHELRHIKNNDFCFKDVQCIESINHNCDKSYMYEMGKELSF